MQSSKATGFGPWLVPDSSTCQRPIARRGDIVQIPSAASRKWGGYLLRVDTVLDNGEISGTPLVLASSWPNVRIVAHFIERNQVISLPFQFTDPDFGERIRTSNALRYAAAAPRSMATRQRQPLPVLPAPGLLVY